jgi:NADPH2:quinone reductase
MKAILVRQTGAPDVMRVETIPDLQPAVGQVLVRVRAAGVNPVDTYIRSGAYARAAALPYTPGMDAAGVVERVGDGVTQWKPGDRVYVAGCLTGAYAEQTLCTPEQLHALPDKCSFAQGAALGVPYATAYRALFHKGRATAGRTLLVHGASGGVGLAAVQLARAAGLRVFGTAGTAAGRALVTREGAHEALDHRDADYLKRVMELTGGRGVDLILEMLANVNLSKDLSALAPFGRVVVIGNRGTIEINPRDAMMRDATILGMTLFNVPPADLAAIHAALAAGLDAGTLRPIIAREFPLADAPRAHEDVLKPGALGKIVLVP